MRQSHFSLSKSILQCTAAGMAIALATPVAASAQEAAEAEAFGADIVVVTARGRAESVQSVPMAITAMTAETLEQKSIQGMDDIARFTPGLSFESYSGGFQSPVIRGQAQTKVTSLESNVATFYDGLYLPRSWSVDLGVASLDRIEVVKGPQSARYGRNAFAGAINYISYKATNKGEPTGEVSATAGIHDRYDFDAKIRLPISSTFGLAATYFHSEYDGSWKNSHPYGDVKVKNGTRGRVGGWNNDSWSVSAYAEPTPGMVFEASYTEFDIQRESNPNITLLETDNQLNCGNIRYGRNALQCGELPGIGDTASADPRSYGTLSSTQIARISASYEFAPNFTGSYLFGRITGDVDISNLTTANASNCGSSCIFQNSPIGSIDYDSHEWRVAYNGSSIDFAFGGFISKGTDNYDFDLVYAAPITDGSNIVPVKDDPRTFTIPLERAVTTTLVRSIFAEAQWTSADGNVRLGAEGRYSWNDLGTTNKRTNRSYQRLFKAFTPRFTAEYDAGPNSMLYASIAKGTKAGGFNATAIAAEHRSFDEEKNWTYELGSKNTFFGNKLTLNAAVFYTDWKAIQINSPDPNAFDPNAVNITQNLGDATVYGIEADFLFTPDSHWSFDGNISYSHGEYGDGTVDARFSRTITPCDDIVCSTDGSVGGNQIERTPRTKAAFGAQWGTELPWENGSFFVRGDVSWQDKLFATPANESYIPSRTLVNMRTGISFKNFDLSFWGRNMFDKKYVANAFVGIIPSGNTYQLFAGQRRTMGLTLKAKY